MQVKTCTYYTNIRASAAQSLNALQTNAKYLAMAGSIPAPLSVTRVAHTLGSLKREITATAAVIIR